MVALNCIRSQRRVIAEKHLIYSYQQFIFTSKRRNYFFTEQLILFRTNLSKKILYFKISDYSKVERSLQDKENSVLVLFWCEITFKIRSYWILCFENNLKTLCKIIIWCDSYLKTKINMVCLNFACCFPSSFRLPFWIGTSQRKCKRLVCLVLSELNCNTTR